MNKQNYPAPPNTNQRGAVLIISLMLLVIMTLIGVTSMRTTILQEKMAGNTRDTMLAFQVAETALLDAENYLETVIVSPAAAFDGTQAGLYPLGADPDLFAATTWTNDNSRAYSGVYDDVATQPRYIIELTGTIESSTKDINVSGYGEASGLGEMTSFRVTARGTGGTDSASALIQSNYGRRF